MAQNNKLPFPLKILQELKNLKQEQTKQDTDIENLDLNKASKAELQEATLALQAELLKAQEEIEATRKDYEAGTIEGQAEGESLYLQDSSNARFREFGIGGNSKQATRSGKNLYNANDKLNFSEGVIVDEEDWITITADNSHETSLMFKNFMTKNSEEIRTSTLYYLVLEIKKVSGEGRLTLCSTGTSGVESAVATSVGVSFSSLTAGKKVYNTTTKESFENLTNISLLRSYAQFEAGQSGAITFRISLLEAEPDLNTFKYEPYGAMPSLKFPSEIETAKDSTNVTVCNKNFFDKNAETIKGTYSGDLSINNDSMTFKSTEFNWNTVNRIAWLVELPNLEKDIYISTESIIRPYTNNAGLYYKFVEDKNVTLPNSSIPGIINISVSANGKQIRITPASKYLMLVLQSQYVDASASTGLPENRTVSVNKLMVSYEENLDYQSHKEQTFTIDVQQEMLEGDTFVKVDGVWKEKHNWGYVSTLNKTSLVISAAASTDSNFFRYSLRDLGTEDKKIGLNTKVYCTHFKNVNSRFGFHEGICGWENNYGFCLGTYDTRYDTANKMKEFLVNNNFEIYYELAEPIYLDCTPRQTKVLDEIEQTLHSYKDGTHIYSTDAVSPIFNVKYTKDTEAYIQAEINKMQAMILAGEE